MLIQRVLCKQMLIEEGLPLDRLAKLTISYPRSLTQKHDWLVCAVNTVKNLGLEPGDTQFIHAIAVRLQMTHATWKKKIEAMKSLGWSEDKTLSVFKRHPHALACSEKKIRNNMDFLIHTVQLEREVIFTNHSLLGYSVEKRIHPRYNVIVVLKSKGLIKGDQKIHYLLMVGEEKFLENYVVKYADVIPGLLEVYMGTANTKKKQLDAT